MTADFDRVQVLYPRGVRTGGPEALHQLARALLDLGVPASLVPVAASRHHERVPEYDHYDVPETCEVDDAPGTLVVLPELDLSPVATLRRARAACWWLSIDGSPLFEAARNARLSRPPGAAHRLRQTKWDLLERRERRRWQQPLMGALTHLAQSEYAWDSLHRRFGIRASMLSDYTSPRDRPEPTPTGPELRPVVSYNGNKGAAAVRQVAEVVGAAAEFVAIRGMTPAQVEEVLQRSAVYLDLGQHPGKDRLPREAALWGCVVMVARRGSGAYTLDVPIPEDHKVDVESTATADVVDAGHVAAQLRAVLDDVGAHFERQRLLRHVVAGERRRFETEVERIFVRGHLGASTSVVDLVGDPDGLTPAQSALRPAAERTRR